VVGDTSTAELPVAQNSSSRTGLALEMIEI